MVLPYYCCQWNIASNYLQSLKKYNPTSSQFCEINDPFSCRCILRILPYFMSCLIFTYFTDKKKGSCKSLEASSIIPPSLKILWNFIQIYSFLLLPCYFKWGHLGIPSVEVIVGQTPKWNETTSHPIVWAKSTPGWKNSKWKGPKSGKNCLQEIPISLVPLQSNEWKRKSRKRESQRYGQLSIYEVPQTIVIAWITS